MKNKLFFFGFFSAFLPFINLLGYFSVFKNIKFSEGVVFYITILYIVSVFICGVLFFDFLLTLLALRFYFGFMVFYIVFKYSSFRFNDVHFQFLFILIVLEALLINTMVQPQMMPNFPDASAFSHFDTGGYQRPYSFSGNASVTSVIMVVLFSLLKFRFLNFLFLSICIGLLSSGVGWVSFLILLLYLLFYKNVIYFFVAFIMLLLLAGLYVIATNDFILIDLGLLSSKISNEYILLLIDFKIEQIKNIFSSFSTLDYLMGDINNYDGIGMGGDFGWGYFYSGFGIFGLGVVFIFLLSKVNRSNLFPLILMVFFTLHYPAMFFLPGQVVLGYVLNYSRMNRDVIDGNNRHAVKCRS